MSEKFAVSVLRLAQLLEIYILQDRRV